MTEPRDDRQAGEHRPDPDELLARVRKEEARQTRGRLKVFFGAAAGVGKTYAMLEAARARRAEGVDVVVGYVEPHGRAETEALLAGLEISPPRIFDYRGATLRELDLDAGLARRPALILVDELAHTNAPGSRHAKRWQDVMELLAAGIDVYTTVNVQHLESLNDVVAKITGVAVRETVPDSILEDADDVELVDLPPDDLLQRLRDGKIYVADQAARAVRQFFRKGNLIALRELALRSTADRVDAQMQVYRREHAIPTTWPVTERILVCVTASPFAPRVVRAARRMATRLRAEWVVAYVETPGDARRSEPDRLQLAETLRLAEQLGAETVTLTGPRVSTELVTYAQSRNVSKVVVGKPARARWREWLFGSVVNELVRESGEIDVYVISGERDEPRPTLSSPPARPADWLRHVQAVAVVALATGLAWLMWPRFALANLIMVYLLGTVVVAVRLGRGPAILASLLSVAAFDFFFVPPFLSFAVSDTEYVVTFGIMLVVALVISTLAVRIRLQADSARERERRTAALYALSRELASTRDVGDLAAAATRHVEDVFRSQAALLLPDGAGGIAARAGHLAILESDTTERGVSRWVYEHGQPAGLGSGTLPGARALYLPLAGSQGAVGVLGVRPADPHAFQTPEQLHLLETFAAQTALAVERATLAEEAQRAQLRVESERLRNSLLSAVSHDLRTPLAAITGAASSLLEAGQPLDPAMRTELIQAIRDEADRLGRLVHNLLQMTRLESGAVEVRREWLPLEEIVGAALARLEGRLGARQVTTRVPTDLPLLAIDGVLIEQALVNLLDNALKYTPDESAIEIAAGADGAAVTIEVADRGPGFAPADETRVFDKFFRSARSGRGSGVGLGLTVCRGIVEAHGGRIWAENRPGGGAAFRFTLPLTDKPPEIDAPSDDDV